MLMVVVPDLLGARVIHGATFGFALKSGTPQRLDDYLF